MATQAPNPRGFKSFDDAFQYPVPVVRRMEQQLRSNINENRDKLRTLVGTSYRDLLGTAERIIEMDQQMHRAENYLSDIGQKCNARAIERIAMNHARTTKSQRERNTGRNGLASTLSLLQHCMTVGGRIIKSRGSSLLAAKLLVLARLLHSSVSKAPDAPPLLNTLRSRLGSLRRKVLSYIDKILSDPKAERKSLIETLSAFSLATTSTPTDVLRHFLNTRAEALTELLEEPTESSVHSALSLLISTLKDANTVFPRRLSDLLARLQGEPLLQDNAVRSTSELNLDVFERWIGEDVRNFTPYLRHDQLQASQATKIIESWAITAKKTLADGLTNLLGSMNDAQKVTALRKDIILRWLSADRKLPGLDQAIFFEDLRSCFLTGLRRIAKESAHDLATEVNRCLEDNTSDDTTTTPIDLWNPANADLDLSKGAVDFRNLIVNVNQGKDGRLQALDKSLSQWSARMSNLTATIKTMREERWDDDLDLDLDEDLDLDSPQDLLAKEDTQALSERLDEARNETLSNVYQQIQSAIPTDSERSTTAPFLLRLLREVLRHSSSEETAAGSSSSTTKPSSSLFDALHTQLAKQVLEKSSYNKATSKGLDFSRPPVVTLWEGNPALPVQPSISCFKLLSEICKVMKDVGSDLWTQGACEALKLRVRWLVVEGLGDSVLKTGELNRENKGERKVDAEEEDEKQKEDGEQETEEADAEISRQKRVQALFDVLYLEKVLSHTSAEQDKGSLESVSGKLKDVVGLEDSAIERLRKSSMDYYRRTYLLFGLLAA